MLRAVFLASVLLSCFLLPLRNADGSTEGHYLRMLIKSQQRYRKSLIDNLRTHRHHLRRRLEEPHVASQNGLMEADKIHALPGQPHRAAFDQYAGYVTVDPSAGRALFYYFVESPNDTSTKPLLLWLNGGPGCSSLGDGALREMGPFIINSDGKTLRANDKAWNNVANVIFLESPAGVGFSYSNKTSDYELSGDKRTADDAYTFLLNWLERFPQYKARDFYIAGESYAGHYVPQLASTILANNKATNLTVINLKGVAMGNAYVDAQTSSKGIFDYYWSHALISDKTHELIQSKCLFTDGDLTDECNDAQNSAEDEVGDIDPYDIYASPCDFFYQNSTLVTPEADPCSHEYAITYLNLPEVQQALHANVTTLPDPWRLCRGFNWTDKPTTMLPTIKDLIASGISVWMFSGDQDAIIPVTATRYFINLLGLPIETSWHAWYSTDRQVGGYVEAYKGLTFATVRGAGHMVPTYQPERALTLISSFLQGKLPPTERSI